MRETVRLAKRHVVKVGAHPSLPDLQGFGRRAMVVSPAEITDLVTYQVGALNAFLLPQHMIQKGRNRDTAWYSMLDTEWLAYKTAYEQFLSPENFDASGTQRQALGVFLEAHRPAAQMIRRHSSPNTED